MDAPGLVAHRVRRMGGFGGIAERHGCRGSGALQAVSGAPVRPLLGRAAAALIAALAAGSARPARAEAPPAESVAPAALPSLTIQWTAPQECPTLADVQGLLETVVPDEVRGRLDGTEADVRIESLEGDAEGFRAHVRVTRGSFVGERELDGRRCEDVARSAIIVVSVALSEAAEHGPANEVAPERVPLDDVELALAPTETQAVPSPTARDNRVDVTVGAGIISGVGSPPVVPRLDVSAGFPGPGSTRFGVRVGVVPGTPVGTGGVVAARLSVVTVAPVACVFTRRSASFGLGGCARLDVGVAIARGESVPAATRGTAPWIALALAPMAEVGRGRVRLRITLELESRLVRPKLVVDNSGTIDRTPILAGGAGLGIVFVIP